MNASNFKPRRKMKGIKKKNPNSMSKREKKK